MRFELTSSQKTFCMKNGNVDDKIWNQGMIQKFNKVYDYQCLNDAFNDLVRNNESLLVSFCRTAADAYMQLNEFEYIEYPFLKLSSDVVLEDELNKFLNETITLDDKLIRCIIFQTPESSGYMINSHHIVVDGFSGLVMAEHINNYLKNPSFTAPTAQSYSEYIEKESKYRQSKRFQRGKQFWSEEFSTDPLCRIAPKEDSFFDYDSDVVTYDFSESFFEKISLFCKNNSVSLPSFFNLIFSTYFHKIYDINNFTIGVPVLNRTTQSELNTIGLYMHILPMIINLTDESFLTNVEKIENSHINLFRHQSFTQYDIQQLLKETKEKTGSLFDVAIDYEELPTSEDYDIDICYSDALSLSLEIHVFNMSDVKKLKIRYRTALFGESDINIMVKSVIALAEAAVNNPDKKISELSMLSTEDEHRLLYEFNDTAVEYDKDTCVYQQFEKQAKENPDRVAVIFKDKRFTYGELDGLVNEYADRLKYFGVKEKEVVAIHLERSYRLIALQLAVLKTGAIFMPIDKRYPEDRIKYACADCCVKLLITDELIEISSTSVVDIQEFDSVTVSEKAETVVNKGPCYIIYTSGSTGKPKGCMLTGMGLLNFCKNNNTLKTLNDTDNCVFGCVNSVSFDYFIAESLLPLTNGFATVVLDDKESTMQKAFNEVVLKMGINVIMTTPTRLKIYFGDKADREALGQLLCICTSGEPLPAELLALMYEKSPLAKIYNPIGPSECSVWDMGGELNREDGIDIHIGKPIANAQIHIVDRHMQLVPIGVTGEICIGGDGVGAGYVNNPELTAEKFVDNPFGEGKLYKTGDLAYWREDGNIVFVGRNDFQVKVRGLRIELGEIESAVASVDGVGLTAAVVRTDKNDVQYICVFYTGENKSAQDIKSVIQKKLPSYMLPHVVTHLEKMPLTSSGKIDRKSLPEIDLENISSESEYIAPVGDKEKQLIECACGVLGVDKISMLDNFFNIGGDSLRAIELISRLEATGYTAAIKTVFVCQNMQELADCLEAVDVEYYEVEYSAVLPATAAQLRVYTSQFLKPDSAHYNIPYAFKVKKLDVEKLENAVNELIGRHESLRTRFENRDGQVVQIIEPSASIKLEKLESDDVTAFNIPFDLSKAPLVRVGYFDNTVIVVMHHIISDGESMNVFFRELNELYMGRSLDSVVQYGEFAVTDSYSEENEKFWLDVFSEEVSVCDLKKDFSRPESRSFNGSQIYDFIDISTHNAISEKCRKTGVTPFVYYMACYSLFLSKFSSGEDVVVATPVSGRSSRYLETVGMFVNTVALRSKPEGNKKIGEFLDEIKRISVAAIENQKYPISELFKKLKMSASSSNPLTDIMFTYQSEEITDIVFGDDKAEVLPVPLSGVKCDLAFTVMPRKNDLVLLTEYSTDLFKEETVRGFVEAYKNILIQALDENEYIKNITIVTQQERQKLLYEFNNTAVEYDKETCVYQMFENQVNEKPDKPAVIFKDVHLTYAELDRLVNDYADKLKLFGVNENDTVAIHLERSHKLIALQLAVLKIGAIFLPLDKRYPEDRIKYACSDCSVKLLITDEMIKLSCTEVVDVDVFDSLTVSKKSETVINKGPCYIIYTSGSTGKPKGCMLTGKGLLNFCKNNNTLKTLNDTYNCVFACVNSVSFDYFIAESLLPLTNGFATVVFDESESTVQRYFAQSVIENGINVVMTTPTRLKIYFDDKADAEALRQLRCICTSGEPLTAELLSLMYEKAPFAKIYNPIGPSECSVWDIGGELNREDGLDIHIGKPIANAQIYIVDKFMQLVPIGVTGEICIGGDGVGAGYVNNPELTAEKFIDNPFGEGKIYKTGDLAYWREDGNIAFVGRNDFQVKVRGLRIELGEIENAVSAVEGVELSVAVVRTDKNGIQYICVFYTGAEKSVQDMKSVIHKKLPSYMLPHIFIHLEEMPLTSSGKINRRLLPTVEFVTNSVFEAPENERERLICDAFSKVLDVDMVGRNSDFFELGGTSLSMISLLSEKFFEKISSAEFMHNSTPKELAVYMSKNEKTKLTYLEPLYESEKTERVLILFPFGGGGAEAFSNLVNEIKAKYSDVSLYFVRYLHSSYECEQAAEEIKNTLSACEVSMYSHCAGAAVAMKILDKLERDGCYMIKHYYSGAIIPVATKGGKNSWNYLPDFMIKSFLCKSGADFSRISSDKQKEIFARFRKDTDYAYKVFFDADRRLITPVTSIISKKDFFTSNYKQAEVQWNKFAENLMEVKFIDTRSHYFQSDNAKELTDLLLK